MHDWKNHGIRVAAVVGSLAIFVAANPAHASLIADGITYTLTESTTGDPLTNQFVLGISGIKGFWIQKTVVRE